MNNRTYDKDVDKAIANVAEAVAAGIAAARAKGVKCGPETNITFKTEEWMGSGMVTSLESLTIGSVDAASAPDARPWWRRVLRIKD